MKLGKYQHYKGQFYNVVQIARHSETEEWMVVYQTLYGDYSWWVRPMSMFNEEVDFNGAKRLRFEYVSEIDLPSEN